jgi:hypothetical protein
MAHTDAYRPSQVRICFDSSARTRIATVDQCLRMRPTAAVILAEIGADMLVATKPVDFRNYAEGTTMRSPRRDVRAAAAFSSVSLSIFRLASGRAQHGQELVGRVEAAALQHRRRHRGERFQLFGRIGTQIDLECFAGWHVQA